LAINNDRASATFTFAATFFRSGQLQMLAQHIEQTLHRIDFESLRLVINRKSYFYHWRHNRVVKCLRATDRKRSIIIRSEHPKFYAALLHNSLQSLAERHPVQTQREFFILRPS